MTLAINIVVFLLQNSAVQDILSPRNVFSIIAPKNEAFSSSRRKVGTLLCFNTSNSGFKARTEYTDLCM